MSRVTRHGTLYRYRQKCRCDECCAAYRNYADGQAEQSRARAKRWKADNPEKHKANKAVYRERHREELRVKNLAYYHARMESDPEAIRENRREWAKTEKGRMANRLARHARRSEPLDPEWAAIIMRDPCSYCGAPGGEIDHITPVALGGGGEWENLTGACRSCNASKNDQPLLAFVGV